MNTPTRLLSVVFAGLAALGLGVGFVGESDAKKVPRPFTYGFVTESGSVPANYPGLVYRDSKGQNHNIKIWRTDGPLKRIPTQITELNSGRFLISPEGGFEPGGQYRFEDHLHHKGKGFRVVVIDVNTQRLDTLNQGEVVFGKQERAWRRFSGSGCDVQSGDFIFKRFQARLIDDTHNWSRLFEMTHRVESLDVNPEKPHLYLSCKRQALRKAKSANFQLSAEGKIPGSAITLNVEPMQASLDVKGCLSMAPSPPPDSFEGRKQREAQIKLLAILGGVLVLSLGLATVVHRRSVQARLRKVAQQDAAADPAEIQNERTEHS